MSSFSLTSSSSTGSSFMWRDAETAGTAQPGEEKAWGKVDKSLMEENEEEGARHFLVEAGGFLPLTGLGIGHK